MRPDAALLTAEREHLVRRDLSIGRSGENDVVLLAETVSRRHAVLRFDGRWWCIEDCGSANGTTVNDRPIPPRVPHPLRHGDRVGIASETLVFSWPAEGADPDRTDELEPGSRENEIALSPLQRQLVRALCGAWLSGTSLELLPTNEQIAEQLGTPDAVGSVKAGLRRVYAKAGISHLPAHAKRRALCRIARQRGWL